jgi:hypothetical protein
LEATVPRESTYLWSARKGAIGGDENLGSLVVYGDLVVSIAILTGEEHLESGFDLDEKAARLR